MLYIDVIYNLFQYRFIINNKLTMQLLNKEMRYISYHKCVISRSLDRKSIFNQILQFSLLILQISILVILFSNMFTNHKVEGSLSTSKSQLKHERNGKCKYQITLTVRKINDFSLMFQNSFYL